MAVSKYKISLTGLPSQILQQDSGDTVLKLRVRTMTGLKTLVLRDQEVVRTEDPFVKHALEHYRPPHLPIKHHPGGVKTHAFHAYEDYSALRPFSSVAVNSTHHHVL